MYRTKTSIKKSKKGRYHNSNTTKNSRTRTRRRTRNVIAKLHKKVELAPTKEMPHKKEHY